MDTFRCPRCGGWVWGKDADTGIVHCHSNQGGRPMSADGGKPCGWKGFNGDFHDPAIPELQDPNVQAEFKRRVIKALTDDDAPESDWRELFDGDPTDG